MIRDQDIQKLITYSFLKFLELVIGQNRTRSNEIFATSRELYQLFRALNHFLRYPVDGGAHGAVALDAAPLFVPDNP